MDEITIKAGRPQKNGIKDGWELFRSGEVLYVYIDERSKGTKYDAAIGLTVDRIKEKFPGMPISRSGVKRIIAMTCSKAAGVQWKITKSIDPLTGYEVTGLGFEEFREFESAYSKKAKAKQK